MVKLLETVGHWDSKINHIGLVVVKKRVQVSVWYSKRFKKTYWDSKMVQRGDRIGFNLVHWGSREFTDAL